MKSNVRILNVGRMAIMQRSHFTIHMMKGAWL
jgi:hypothetical protein